MKKSTLLLTTMCAAAGIIPLSSAMAAAPVGTAGNIGLGYSNLSSSDGGSVNSYGGDGTIAFGFGPDFGAQIGGKYDSLNASNGGGTNISDWGIGGSLFWAPGMTGRLGVMVNYDSLSGSGVTLNTTSYGGWGEWYAGNAFTLAGKVGGASLSGSANTGCGGEGGSHGGFCFGSGSASESGWYVGGGATFYVMPDLALGGAVTYIGVNDFSETTYGASLEWLISESTPISIIGGYSNISPAASGGGTIPSISEWTVALKFYFNGDNSMSLRDRQRNGASGWAAQAPEIVE